MKFFSGSFSTASYSIFQFSGSVNFCNESESLDPYPDFTDPDPVNPSATGIANQQKIIIPVHHVSEKTCSSILIECTGSVWLSYQFDGIMVLKKRKDPDSEPNL